MQDIKVLPTQSDTPSQVPAEMKAFLQGILDEADILILDDVEKEAVIQNMYFQLDAFLLEQVIAALPDEKIEEFSTLSEEEGSVEKVQAFIESALPNAKEIFEKAYEEFRQWYLDTIAIEEAKSDAFDEQMQSSDEHVSLKTLANGQPASTQ